MTAFKLPEIPESEKKKIQTQRSSVRHPKRNQKPSGLTKLQPFRMAAVIAVLIGVLTAGGVVFNVIDGGARYETGYETGTSMELYDPYEVQPVSVFIGSANKPIVTFQIDKEDGQYDLSSGYMEMTHDGDIVNRFVEIPAMGPSTTTVYVSAEADIYYTPEELDQIDLDTFDLQMEPDEWVYASDFSQYLDSGSADLQTLRRIYRARYPEEYPEFAVLDNGLDSSDHQVSYSVSYHLDGEIDQEYLYGKGQILFEKDGQVVYADIISADGENSPSNGKNSFLGTYTPPVSLPDYDSVRIIGLD